MQFRITIKGTRLFRYLQSMPAFLKEYKEIKRQANLLSPDFPFDNFYPCFEDRTQESGTASGQYFHQDLLIAGKIFKNDPIKHVDIGSRMDGFIAHVASFREIEFFDIRKMTNLIDNIKFVQADLMDENFKMVDYCDSVSCLHALEHFGLGRYGDRIDYQGHIRGWENLYTILKRGGKLYFSVPIGKQRIEFNAHRVFSIEYLLTMIKGRYAINSFSYVNDTGDLVKDAIINKDSISNNFCCHCGCGIFELTKL